MKKIAGFIVNIRYLIFLLVAVALAFSFVSSKWVKVENDLVEYLPETSETKIGQRLMQEQFFTYGSAEVMVANITAEDAEMLCDEIKTISSVKSVDFDPESTNENTGTVPMFYEEQGLDGLARADAEIWE